MGSIKTVWVVMIAADGDGYPGTADGLATEACSSIGAATPMPASAPTPMSTSFLQRLG